MKYCYSLPAILSAAIVAIAAGAAHAGETIKIGGTGASNAMAAIAAEIYGRTQQDVAVEVVEGLGTSGGIRALTAGAISASFSSRMLKEKESGKGAVSAPFLRTPFVLVTSRTATTALDSKAVSTLYDDPRSRWPDGTPVKVILRPKSESDTTLLLNFFPGMKESLPKARARGDIPVAQTDQDNAGMAESISGSLTTATWLQILTEKRRLQPITIDGAVPSVKTVADGTYPYSKILYLVHADTPTPAVAAFLAFLRSPEFAQELERNGAVPVQ